MEVIAQMIHGKSTLIAFEEGGFAASIVAPCGCRSFATVPRKAGWSASSGKLPLGQS